MKLFFLSILLCGLVQPEVSIGAYQWQVFVATNGNDAWSGRTSVVEAPHGPKKTVSAALNRLRHLRGGQTTPATLWLKGGTYRLEEPIILSSVDSGLSILALDTNKALLSGGRVITGWKPSATNPAVWWVDLPSDRNQVAGRQMFVNGERRIRCRTPNDGYFQIDGASSQDKPMTIKYSGNDISPHWADSGEVELIAQLAWATVRMPIRKVDADERVATLAGNPHTSNRENNARYYIENTPEALDSPGEWYWNRKTGRLWYWSKPKETIPKSEVILSKLSELLVIRGNPGGAVTNMILRGLSFVDADWTLGPNGHTDTQAAVGIAGDVRGEHWSDSAVVDCSFRRLGGYGLELGKGCQRIRVVGCEFADLGAGGIRIGEEVMPNSAWTANHSHQIINNHLHHLGEVYPAAVGVLNLQSYANRVAYNHIHHLYYTAISLGWTWGYQSNACFGHRIEFNHLHHIGQGRLSDMGGVYTLGPQPGTVIRNNLIHDVVSHNYGGWGLYADEGSTGIVFENNIVHRTKSAGFHQHFGRENIIRNNIFAFGAENQLARTRADPHRSFTMTNNIVYYTSALFQGNWSGNLVIDRNLYFKAGPPTEQKKLETLLTEWRALGYDLKSIVADPLFENPQAGDFRLKPHSPALRMGFKPIDTVNIGIRAKALP